MGKFVFSFLFLFTQLSFIQYGFTADNQTEAIEQFSSDDIVIHLDKDIVDSLSQQELEAFQKAAGGIAKSVKNLGTTTPAPEEKPDTQEAEPWSHEDWTSFAYDGQVVVPLDKSKLKNRVFNVKMLFGQFTAYTGFKPIFMDIKKNIQTGIDQVLLVIPQRVTAPNQLSVRDSGQKLLGSVRTALSQLVGLNEVVPAWTPEEVTTLQTILQNAHQVERHLQNAILHYSRAHDTIFHHTQIEFNAPMWDEETENQAIEQVDSQLDAIHKERGLAPDTRARLKNILLSVKEKEHRARAISESPKIQNMAREVGFDLRIYDAPLMRSVHRRLWELESEHEQNWLKAQPALLQSSYDTLAPLFTGRPEELIQAVADHLQRQKQQHFFEMIRTDDQINHCHPRAEGMGELMAELGRGLAIIRDSEQAFADSLQARRQEFVGKVNKKHFLRSWSEAFRNQKADELMTAEYQRDRNEQYEEIENGLHKAGLKNVANLLHTTLADLRDPDHLTSFLKKQDIPARAMVWNMPVLNPKEWIKANAESKGTNYKTFERWVKSTDTLWRLQAMVADASQAYRTMMDKVYYGQFINGPFGLRSWEESEPFSSELVLDPETGSFVSDKTKLHDTWASNMRSIWKTGKDLWNYEGSGMIPPLLVSAVTKPAAVVVTPTFALGMTAYRASMTAAVGAATLAAGNQVTARVWAPVWALLKTGFSLLPYDFRRPLPIKADGTISFEETFNQITPTLTKMASDAVVNGINKAAPKVGRWLIYGSTLAGLLYGGSLDYFAGTLNMQAGFQGIMAAPVYYGAKGLLLGSGLSLIHAASKRGIMSAVGGILTGVTTNLERLFASLVLIPLQAAKTAVWDVGLKSAKNIGPLVRDSIVRDVILNAFFDFTLPMIGGSGVRRKPFFLMHETQGPGVASTEFHGVQSDFALLSVWVEMQREKDPNWVDLNNSTDERSKKLAKIIHLTDSMKNKVRLSKKELDALRTKATALVEKVFGDQAKETTLWTQRAVRQNAGEALEYNWAGLADSFLASVFGAGILQPLEKVDESSRVEYTYPTLTAIAKQLLAGQNLDLARSKTVESHIDKIQATKPTLDFIGAEQLAAESLCSKSLLVQAKLPWQNKP